DRVVAGDPTGAAWGEIQPGAPAATVDEGALAARDLAAIAAAFVAGAQIPWERLYDAPSPRRTPLPGYTFARVRDWAPRVTARTPIRAEQGPVEERIVLRAGDWIVGDHRVNGRAVLPGVAYLDLAASARWRRSGEGPIRLIDVVWLEPAFVDAEIELRL